MWVLSRLFALGDAQIQPPQEVGLRAREVIYLTLNMPSSSCVDGVERLAADHVMNPLSHQTNSLATEHRLNACDDGWIVVRCRRK